MDVEVNKIYCGDCLDILQNFPSNFLDIVVTSPPYWGQRLSFGVGTEDDPRIYLDNLVQRFNQIFRILKKDGIMWINIGDAYNTPINWNSNDFEYSSLGKDKIGLNINNSAYTKPRYKRKAFIDKTNKWLKYGNLLALPQRLIVSLCDFGWYYRGEVIWNKKNPMPEGKCRRPHRKHEGIYLFSKSEKHSFVVSHSVKSVWELNNQPSNKIKHFSKFPIELPKKCIESYGKQGSDIIVLDPYFGSGTTGMAALECGCSYIGIEIDKNLTKQTGELFEKVVKDAQKS